MKFILFVVSLAASFISLRATEPISFRTTQVFDGDEGAGAVSRGIVSLNAIKLVPTLPIGYMPASLQLNSKGDISLFMEKVQTAHKLAIDEKTLHFKAPPDLYTALKTLYARDNWQDIAKLVILHTRIVGGGIYITGSQSSRFMDVKEYAPDGDLIAVTPVPFDGAIAITVSRPGVDNNWIAAIDLKSRRVRWQWQAGVELLMTELQWVNHRYILATFPGRRDNSCSLLDVLAKRVAFSDDSPPEVKYVMWHDMLLRVNTIKPFDVHSIFSLAAEQ